jgi:hypothetical protein
MKKEQLIITFSEEATEKYLKLCRASTEAHVNADVQPSFPSLRIDLDMIDSIGYLIASDKDIELGDVISRIQTTDG